MEVPNSDLPIWKDLVNSKIDIELDFLAAKLLISRLRLLVYQNRDDETIARAAREIHEFYIKHVKLPSAQKDITALASIAGIVNI